MAERTLTLLLAMPDVDEPLDPAPLRAAAAAHGGTPEPTESEGHLFSFLSASRDGVAALLRESGLTVVATVP